MSRVIAKSQHAKYVAFKKAFETISHYLDHENFIAAYVISFSLIEDRVRAMAVIHYQYQNNGKLPPLNYISAPFTSHIRRLEAANYMAQQDAVSLLEQAKIRNELLHSAMWNLHSFTKESVQQALALARLVDKHRRAQKRVLNK